MDLKSYLAILSGHKWVILITTLVSVLFVSLITFLIIPNYTASTTLRVATASTGVVGYSDYMYADRLMNTYIKLATSRPILDKLVKELNLQFPPEISVVTIPNTELIKISVESSNPLIAQDSANKLGEIIIAQGKELYSGSGKSAQDILGEQLIQAENELKKARQDYSVYVNQTPDDTVRIAAMTEAIQLKEQTYATLLDQYDQARLKETIRANIISVVEPAILPLYPSSPNKPMNIGLGFLVGLAGGIGLAFLYENLGTRLYTSKQIEAVAELKTIGKIPTIQRKSLFRLNRRDDERIKGPFNEAFRRLHINILMEDQNKSIGNSGRTFLITSSEPGEGKSTITSNLAVAIAKSGKKVIVVDCDLHIPKQHEINGLPNKVGLSNLLMQQAKFEDVVQVTHNSGMHVITSGPLPPDPMKMLGSSQMNSLLHFLSKQYDLVLIDTPALLVLADAILLAPMVDGVVLIARRNYIKEEAVAEACRQLANIKARMIGLVVNEAERNGSYYYDRR